MLILHKTDDMQLCDIPYDTDSMIFTNFFLKNRFSFFNMKYMRLKFQYTLFILFFIFLIPRSFWGIWAIFEKTDSLKIFL